MNKIAVILDTQIAHSPDLNCRFNDLQIFGYDNTVSFVERHDLVDMVDVFIPDLVLSEITEHRIKKLSSSLKEIRKIYDYFDGSNILNMDKFPQEDFKLREYIDTLKERKLKQGIFIIPIPVDKTILFDEILKMAIKKIPPFREKESDKGFKDAVIFISIINYFRENAYDEIFLFSSDGGFSGIDVDSVKDKYGINLKIIKGGKIQEFLALKYKLKIDLQEFLNKGNFLKVLIKIIKKSFSGNKTFIEKLLPKGYEVEDVCISKYSINEINESECEVYILATVKLMKDGVHESDLDQNFKIIFYKTNSDEWKMKSIE